MAVLPPDPIFILRSPDMTSVNSLCFMNNDRLLAGSAKGIIHLWDLQINRSPLCFQVGSVPITTLHHLEDNVISQEKGGCVKYWSLVNARYKLKNSFEADHVAFCRTEVISETNTLIVPKKENEICLLSLQDFEIQQTLVPDFQTKLGHVSSLKAINVDGVYFILAGYESGDILFWDLKTSKAINQIHIGEPIMALDCDIVTNRGICGGPGDKITTFSISKRSLTLIKDSEIGIKNAGVNCLKIRRDKKVFASAGWDGRIRIFSWKSLRQLAVLTEHKNGGVMDICYSKHIISLWNAPVMVAGGADGQITLWDLYN